MWIKNKNNYSFLRCYTTYWTPYRINQLENAQNTKKIEIDLSKMNDLIPKHELKLNLLQSQLENLDQKKNCW